jgi:GT2 family glycosyltransferase
VESVLAGTRVPAEIVVIDQSDTMNGLLAELPFPNGCELRHIRTGSHGLGHARNNAVEAARYDIIVFLDDDMYVRRDWFERIVSALTSAGRSSAVTGQVLAAQPEFQFEGAFAPSLISDARPCIYSGRVPKDVLFVGNMAAWKDVLSTTGLFDEELGPGTRFPSAEDNDFGFRLLEAGYSIRYVPDAVVYHRCWRSRDEYFSLRWSYGVGQGAFYIKHAQIRHPHMLTRMSRDVARRVVRLPWLCVRNRHAARGEATFVVGMLTGAVQWLWTRKRR